MIVVLHLEHLATTQSENTFATVPMAWVVLVPLTAHVLRYSVVAPNSPSKAMLLLVNAILSRIANADGVDVSFEFKCSCDGDDCNYRLVESIPVDGAQCVSCPVLPKVTWFNGATNILRVGGPNGALVKSRVQPNLEMSQNWNEYTVLLLLPGDFTKTRIFSWIYDIDLTIVESDGSSTLVFLSQNQNSPNLLQNKWSRFFVGFDNIPNTVTDITDFRMGVIPGLSSEHNMECLIDALPVEPQESESRKVLREIREEKLDDLEDIEELKNPRTRRQAENENLVQQAINYIFS